MRMIASCLMELVKESKNPVGRANASLAQCWIKTIKRDRSLKLLSSHEPSQNIIRNCKRSEVPDASSCETYPSVEENYVFATIFRTNILGGQTKPIFQKHLVAPKDRSFCLLLVSFQGAE